MARTKTVEVDLPIDLYEELRDKELQRLGKREFMTRRGCNNTYGGNGPLGQLLLEVLFGSRANLSDSWYDGRELEPTTEGQITIAEKPRADDGTFTSGD
jgi:hypothetical protein